MALVLFELGFETLKERESIGRGTGKAGQHLVAVQLAHLAGAGFDDDAAQRHLAVAAQGDG